VRQIRQPRRAPKGSADSRPRTFFPLCSSCRGAWHRRVLPLHHALHDLRMYGAGVVRAKNLERLLDDMVFPVFQYGFPFADSYGPAHGDTCLCTLSWVPVSRGCQSGQGAGLSTAGGRPQVCAPEAWIVRVLSGVINGCYRGQTGWRISYWAQRQVASSRARRQATFCQRRLASILSSS